LAAGVVTRDELTETLRRELAPLRDDLIAMQERLSRAIEPLVAGIPLLHRGIEALRQDVRQIRAAVNDLAAVQMTSGEATALHEDVNKTMTRQDEFESRLAVVERIVRELEQRR
jgi:hypothetical protein